MHKSSFLLVEAHDKRRIGTPDGGEIVIDNLSGMRMRIQIELEDDPAQTRPQSLTYIKPEDRWGVSGFSMQTAMRSFDQYRKQYMKTYDAKYEEEGDPVVAKIKNLSPNQKKALAAML